MQLIQGTSLALCCSQSHAEEGNEAEINTYFRRIMRISYPRSITNKFPLIQWQSYFNLTQLHSQKNKQPIYSQPS